MTPNDDSDEKKKSQNHNNPLINNGIPPGSVATSRHFDASRPSFLAQFGLSVNYQMNAHETERALGLLATLATSEAVTAFQTWLAGNPSHAEIGPASRLMAVAHLMYGNSPLANNVQSGALTQYLVGDPVYDSHVKAGQRLQAIVARRMLILDDKGASTSVELGCEALGHVLGVNVRYHVPSSIQLLGAGKHCHTPDSGFSLTDPRASQPTVHVHNDREHTHYVPMIPVKTRVAGKSITVLQKVSAGSVDGKDNCAFLAVANGYRMQQTSARQQSKAQHKRMADKPAQQASEQQAKTPPLLTPASPVADNSSAGMSAGVVSDSGSSAVVCASASGLSTTQPQPTHFLPQVSQTLGYLTDDTHERERLGELAQRESTPDRISGKEEIAQIYSDHLVSLCVAAFGEGILKELEQSKVEGNAIPDKLVALAERAMLTTRAIEQQTQGYDAINQNKTKKPAAAMKDASRSPQSQQVQPASVAASLFSAKTKPTTAAPSLSSQKTCRQEETAARTQEGATGMTTPSMVRAG